jgi:hypothetical protein
LVRVVRLIGESKLSEVLGSCQGRLRNFAYGTVTRCGPAFHPVPLSRNFVTSRPAGRRIKPGPNETISSTSLTHRWTSVRQDQKLDAPCKQTYTRDDPGFTRYLAEACVLFPQSTVTYAMENYNSGTRECNLPFLHLSPPPAN